MSLSALTQTSRPPFLILTPACVLLGASATYHLQYAINYRLLIVILVGALLAHISVNMLNEYWDFKSGLDLNTNRTPFSGGSGTLPSQPQLATPTLLTGSASLLIAIGLGLYLISVSSIELLPIGLTGSFIIIAYTQWINRSPWLCLIAPGFGIGIMMIMGTHVVLAGELAPKIWLIALPPFFLINTLLLLNQYPDIEADQSVGRRHFPIVFGITQSNRIYALFTLAAYGTICVLVLQHQLPFLSLIALAPAPLCLYALTGVSKYGRDIGHHARYLFANVIATITTPFLLGLSLLL